MTVSRAEQARRDDQKREALVSKLFTKITWNHYLQAAEVGITQAMTMAGEEYPTSIMLAHVVDPSKSFEDLSNLGLIELNKIIFGDLLPEEMAGLDDE